MKVYILAAMNNTSFAEKLLGGIRNIKIISKPSTAEINSDVNETLKRKMESADVILAIIDDTFCENVVLNLELQLAQVLVRENRNKDLIPVVLDRASVPASIEKTLYITCASDSEQDLCNTQLILEKMLTHRYYKVKNKKLKENNSRTSYMILLTLAIEIFAIFFIILFFKEQPFNMDGIRDEDAITSVLGLTSVVISIVTLSTSYLSIMRRRWQEEDDDELESYSRRLRQAIVPEELKEEIKQEERKGFVKEEKKKEIDALGRMMINLEDIK